MFLQGKKGAEDIVLKSVIVLVIAIIMIFVVTAWGAKIWSTFFPSDDRSTLKTFDLLYNVINLEAESKLGFDSNPVMLYLKKGYCVVLFDAATVSEGRLGVGGDVYYAPDECGSSDCLCLYDGEPRQDSDKKEKNLIKCNTFTTKLYIDQDYISSQYTDLNHKLCSSSGERYTPLLVLGRNKVDRHYIIILNDNDANKAEVDKLKVSVCPDSGNSLCNGKEAGAVITFNDEAGMDKIQAYCEKDEEGKSYKSTSITCIYREGSSCRVDCSNSDISSQCETTYKTCSDFNKIDSGITTSISIEKDYQNYYMCKNDAKYCKHNCEPVPYQVYATKPQSMSEIKDGTLYVGGQIGSVLSSKGYIPGFPELTDKMLQACNVKFSDKLTNGNRYMIYYDDTLSYTSTIESKDESVVTCKSVIENIFYPKSTVFECKSDTAACLKFIEDRRADCSIVSDIVSEIDENKLWLAYYDSVCDAEVKDLFSEIDVCQTAKPAPEIH